MPEIGTGFIVGEYQDALLLGDDLLVHGTDRFAFVIDALVKIKVDHLPSVECQGAKRMRAHAQS
jgi:hypothetical protein